MEYVKLMEEKGVNMEEINIDTILKYVSARRDDEGSFALQWRFEAAVSSDNELALIASRAFRSFIRAYSTHSKDTKHIFNKRDLHLGHIAKSFALKENPTEVSKKITHEVQAARKPKLIPRMKTEIDHALEFM